MPQWLFPWIFVLIGYPIGTFQTAFFVGKIFGKINIKEHGSGNAGATNVYRVMGFRHGLIVLFFDILKTIIPIIILNYFLYDGRIWDITPYEAIPGLLMAFGVFLGHCFPFWMRFRGGKGVACSLGMLIMFDPWIMFIVLGICIVIVVLSRYISLASVTGYISLAGVTTLRYSDYFIILAIIWVLAAIGIATHHKNIKDLFSGQEKRFNLGRKKPKE